MSRTVGLATGSLSAYTDSWVNATQILKVAGIPKSARTKILEKEIQQGTHEKVQGGCELALPIILANADELDGKYQGTWYVPIFKLGLHLLTIRIPFPRGQELAAQYGVTAYLAPIFDFDPSPGGMQALPVARSEATPDQSSKTPGPAHGMPQGHTSAYVLHPSASGQMLSPFSSGPLAQPPPQWGADGNFYPPHPSAMAYHGQPNVYYQPPPPPQYANAIPSHGHRSMPSIEMTPSRSNEALAPAAELNGMGLPASGTEIYVDQFGNPQMIHENHFVESNGDMAPPPAKRQRSEDNVPNGTEGEPMEEDDDDDLDEIQDAPPLPSFMRLASKPLRPKPTASASKARTKLLSLFSMDGQVDLRSVFGLSVNDTPDFDIDMVIDNQGHTALHWACSLAKTQVAVQLIALGADIHRGNFAGETALIRSVLTTNHAEAGSFGDLLVHLAPSIRTLDQAYRTVIHHIALIAGVKGRAQSARSYMASVLEWVAKEQRSAASTIQQGQDGMNGAATNFSLKPLVDVQDVHGDTALNVAARVGNKGLVKLLLDAGADKAKANKLGLKPADFGLEVEVGCTVT